MHLGIEWPCFGGSTKRSERFRVAALARERHSKIERGVAVLGSCIEHGSKRDLRVRELLALQRLPSLREGRVDGAQACAAARVGADSSLPRPHGGERDGQE
jgi:hypothetical protein